MVRGLHGVRVGGWLHWGLLTVAGVFFGLCFVHLKADFPNHSPWNDWSKMTDEGWYGGAAVRHAIGGNWYLQRSFNPAVALPVWPAMLAGWFSLTGAGMVAARVLAVLLYGASLVLLYLVVRGARGELVAAGAVALTAVNPFCYAFDRLAILEPLMVFWMMLGLWLASRVRRDGLVWCGLLGVVIALLVLTKSTGFFLVPAILFQMWGSMGFPRRSWIKPIGTAGIAALLLWVGYFAVFVRPHLADNHLLFAINKDRVHLSIMPLMAWRTMLDGMWIDRVVFPVAVLLVALSAVWLRALWRVPLFGASVLAMAGYMTFIWYHTFLQPRYYLVVAMPVAVVVVLGVDALWQRRMIWVAWGLGGLVGLAGVGMAVRTLEYVVRPEYSFVTAADALARTMQAEGGEQLLLGSSADDVAMMTGVPGLCSEYGVGGIDGMLDLYRPEWFAVWNGEEAYAKRWFGGRYRMVERGRYRVFDDPERNELVLYRLEEKPGYVDRPGDVLRFMR